VTTAVSYIFQNHYTLVCSNVPARKCGDSLSYSNTFLFRWTVSDSETVNTSPEQQRQIASQY